MGFLRSNHLPGEIVDLARKPTEPDRKSSSIDLDQMEFHRQLSMGDLFARAVEYRRPTIGPGPTSENTRHSERPTVPRRGRRDSPAHSMSSADATGRPIVEKRDAMESPTPGTFTRSIREGALITDIVGAGLRLN
jgi:hypothetical protein